MIIQFVFNDIIILFQYHKINSKSFIIKLEIVFVNDTIKWIRRAGWYECHEFVQWIKKSIRRKQFLLWLPKTQPRLG